MKRSMLLLAASLHACSSFTLPRPRPTAALARHQRSLRVYAAAVAQPPDPPSSGPLTLKFGSKTINFTGLWFLTSMTVWVIALYPLVLFAALLSRLFDPAQRRPMDFMAQSAARESALGPRARTEIGFRGGVAAASRPERRRVRPRRRGWDRPRTGRGDAAAGTWIVRGGGSRRRRGWDLDSPWRRVAAPPRQRRGYSVDGSPRRSPGNRGLRAGLALGALLDAHVPLPAQGVGPRAPAAARHARLVRAEPLLARCRAETRRRRSVLQ